MKKFVLMICLLAGYFAQAQQVIKYYDYKWKECDVSLARFYSIKVKTDSGWLVNDNFLSTRKLQMSGLYKDEACKIQNGTFFWFYPNQQVSSTGRYVNGKKDGTWLSYDYSGMMSDSTNYELGQPTGTSKGWHKNGLMSDSTEYGVDGVDVYVKWFDNGSPSSAGKTKDRKKTGTWRFFHNNANTAALEKYEQDVLLSRIYYDENGTQETDTSSKDRSATFKGSEVKWKNFLENNLQFPHNVKLVNTDIITVVLVATIDEEGNVKDVYVEIPFDKLFDEEALRVMKRSPKWTPAISHNRKITTRIRQPISFSQD